MTDCTGSLADDKKDVALEEELDSKHDIFASSPSTLDYSRNAKFTGSTGSAFQPVPMSPINQFAAAAANFMAMASPVYAAMQVQNMLMAVRARNLNFQNNV